MNKRMQQRESAGQVITKTVDSNVVDSVMMHAGSGKTVNQAQHKPLCILIVWKQIGKRIADPFRDFIGGQFARQQFQNDARRTAFFI